MIEQIRKPSLEKFRQEMRELADRETAEGHGHFADLTGGPFNPNDLDEKDMQIYHAFLEGKLSHIELETRKMNLDKKLNPSQDMLLGYISNKLIGFPGREYDES
jgi:hypothetical protein